MMAESPHYDVDLSSLPNYGPNASAVPEIDLPHQLYGKLAAVFRDMQYLTKINTVPPGTFTGVDYITFSRLRTSIQHRLLSLRLDKATSEMNDLDFSLDICRIAALIYIPRALHGFKPPMAVMHSLKLQLMTAFRGKEENQIADTEGREPGRLVWALFMGGILPLEEGEEEWFAQRIDRRIQSTGIAKWAQMENYLKKVCWTDWLHTPSCKRLWSRVESINRECWASQVRIYMSVETRWMPCQVNLLFPGRQVLDVRRMELWS